MESNRTGYSIKKLSIDNKGASLFSAILIALFALLALEGLYFALTKLLGSAQTIKTYTSVRDAAAGGSHYAASVIVEEMIHEIISGDRNIGDCQQVNLKFKLFASSGTYDNQISVCYLMQKPKPGWGKAYERVIGSSSSSSSSNINEYYFYFTIISEATGPQNTRSRIEAVYAR